MMQPPRMDLDDRVLHYLLVGVGLGLGSFIKTGWDKLSDRLWDKEGQEFKKWKAQIKDTKK